MSNTRFFTTYWAKHVCDDHRHYVQRCNGACSSRFATRGVAPGDFLYIVSLDEGRMKLIGRMKVGQVVDREQASRLLNNPDLWEGDVWCVSAPEDATEADFDRIVPDDIARRLRFLRANGDVSGLVYDARDPSRIDNQTLRTVRELTPASAGFLDDLLDDSA